MTSLHLGLCVHDVHNASLVTVVHFSCTSFSWMRDTDNTYMTNILHLNPICVMLHTYKIVQSSYIIALLSNVISASLPVVLPCSSPKAEFPSADWGTRWISRWLPVLREVQESCQWLYNPTSTSAWMCFCHNRQTYDPHTKRWNRVSQRSQKCVCSSRGGRRWNSQSNTKTTWKQKAIVVNVIWNEILEAVW